MMQFQVSSSQETEIIDITEEVASRIEGGDGVCTVFVPHTTAGLTVNENEQRLITDMEEYIRDSVPDREYRHDQIDDNAASHLRNLMLDASVSIPIEDGRLQLGTWQSILFIELDGPRKRTVQLTVTE